jgi:hypothetical protein
MLPRSIILAGIAFGLSGCLGYVVVLGRTSKTQRVDFSPVTDLRLRDGVRSLKSAFPDARAFGSGGGRLWDGCLESLYFPVDECSVAIHVYETTFRASAAFDRLPEEYCRYRSSRSPDENEVSGSGHDRLCVSPIRENRGSNWLWGYYATGTYDSYAIVQKRNVLVVFREESREEPVARKQWAVHAVARGLRPYAE